MVQATEYLYVVRDDAILHGEPIIRRTRTPVRAILDDGSSLSVDSFNRPFANKRVFVG